MNPEQPKSEYIKAPLHVARCLGELTVMWAQEKRRALLAKLDALDQATHDAFGEDDPEDQAISSERWA